MIKDKRRKSLVVHIGHLPIGGQYPIRIQSMTNVSTLDTEKSIQQCIRIIKAGGEYIRISTQGIREVENLKKIKDGLMAMGYNPPLIADVHFRPQIAEKAAQIVEKVRINPGNFVYSNEKTRENFTFSSEKNQVELEKIKKKFSSFLDICKEQHTAIRIGVNHGSLSNRILNHYGDTPQGMVFSCIEFLRICIEENFLQTVVSIKASNTNLMIQTVRLLVKQMKKEKMNFPLHLGVTEAGEGSDGRIKSVIGIGTLLLEGIGDTIRISLSEEPEVEIRIAKLLINYIKEKKQFFHTKYIIPIPKNKRTNRNIYIIADRSYTPSFFFHPNFSPDFVYIGKQKIANTSSCKIPIIVDFSVFSFKENTFPLFTIQEKEEWVLCEISKSFLLLNYLELNNEIISILKKKPQTIVLVYSKQNNIYEQKATIFTLIQAGVINTLILKESYSENDIETFQIKASIDCGPFLLDLFTEGIMIGNQSENISSEIIEKCSFNILQATGRRISKIEYIACPGCGRTLFDIQTMLKQIKKATNHLKGLKIAVMGCIINGLGEMTNANFGYIGSKKGQVNLYKGRTCIQKNIPEEKAADILLSLIKCSSKKENR